MRILLLTVAGILALVSTCGCTDESSPDTRDAQSVQPATPAPGAGVSNTDDPKEWIRKRYERTVQMEQNGQLRCDTLSYRCGGMARYGSFKFCYAGEELMRAGHQMTEGDHFSVTESYFFDGEELYFTHLTQGAWHFGGPMQRDDAGREVPGTIDEVHEERIYSAGGNLLDRLFKDYTIKAGGDSPTPEEVPNQATGQGVDAELGSEVLLQVAASGSYGCD